MKSCTPVTTIGMTVQGFETQVTSATMPTFMTCASICPKPAAMALRPAPSGIRTPAGRMNGLTMSPTRKRELLHPPVHAGADDGLVEIHLGLGQRGFGAGLFGGKKRGDPRLGASLAAVAAAIAPWRPSTATCSLLDVPRGDGARVAPIDLLLGLQFVHGLLVGALGLLDLAFGRHDIRSRDHQRRLDLGDLAAGGLHGRLLLRAVEPEDRRALLDLAR